MGHMPHLNRYYFVIDLQNFFYFTIRNSHIFDRSLHEYHNIYSYEVGEKLIILFMENERVLC